MYALAKNSRAWLTKPTQSTRRINAPSYLFQKPKIQNKNFDSSWLCFATASIRCALALPPRSSPNTKVYETETRRETLVPPPICKEERANHNSSPSPQKSPASRVGTSVKAQIFLIYSWLYLYNRITVLPSAQSKL